MNKHVFNLSLGAGWGLTSVGVGLWSVPAGLVTAGALLIIFTFAGAILASRVG